MASSTPLVGDPTGSGSRSACSSTRWAASPSLVESVAGDLGDRRPASSSASTGLVALDRPRRVGASASVDLGLRRRRRRLGGRRQQRPAHVGEPAGHPLHEVGELGGDLGDPLALGHAGTARGGRRRTRGSRAGPAGPAPRPRPAPARTRRPAGVGLGASTSVASTEPVEAALLVAAGGEQPVGLGLRLGDGRVGRALGEEQRAADRLGLVDRRVDLARQAARVLAASGACCDSSCSRATAARARASIAVASFCAASRAAATSSTKVSTSAWS